MKFPLPAREGVRGWGSPAQAPFPDNLKNTHNIFDHFIIPKSQNHESIRTQTGIPLCIVLLIFRMLPTIKLYDNPFIEGDEVNNIRLNRLLSAEFYAFNLSVF